MTKREKDIKLIKASIVRWDLIKSDINTEPTGIDCPLCKAYANWQDFDQICMDCPIYKATGEPACKNTPYYEYVRLRNIAMATGTIRHESERVAKAKEMLRLLKSLLPKNKKKTISRKK